MTVSHTAESDATALPKTGTEELDSPVPAEMPGLVSKSDVSDKTLADDGFPDFEWSYTAEPHATRHKVIVKKHPEIKKLFGPDPALKWKVFFAVTAQVVFAYLLRHSPWWAIVTVAYTIGGTINHAMTLGMHEISHNLGFRKLWKNRALGIFANLPFGIPAFASFKRYHMEHHRYQGEDGIDVDLPTRAEVALFSSTPGKVLWCFLQPAFYALRPLFVLPKKPRRMEVINITAQLAFDIAVFHFFGVKSLVYLIIGTLLGMGLHPMAGHFIAEHYTFLRGQETYSYYGPLNWFSFNVGYHNEHHDFPNIPGSRLPLVRKIAPEFYETLPYHSGWTKVILDYIRFPIMGPNRRMKRVALSEEDRSVIMSQ